VHYRTIQINHQPEATIFCLFSWRLFTAQHVSGVFPAHHQEHNDCSGSLWFYLRIVVTVVLCSWSGRPAGPTNWANLSKLSSFGKLLQYFMNFLRHVMMWSNISCNDSSQRQHLGHTVAQLVEVLRYRPECRGFHYRWCQWNFSLT
jgi:hypothetical protein